MWVHQTIRYILLLDKHNPSKIKFTIELENNFFDITINRISRKHYVSNIYRSLTYFGNKVIHSTFKTMNSLYKLINTIKQNLIMILSLKFMLVKLAVL